MKKFLSFLIFSLLSMSVYVPAFAATVYLSEDGNNKVDIYGNLRANIGYFAGFNKQNINHNFLYGLQGNSRVGVNVRMGAFSGRVEFGANEKTLVSQAATAVGIREAWASVAFGENGKYGALSFGKMESLTSMGGFISTVWDNDGSLMGFGGSSTSTRRFQVQYAIAGFHVGLIEKEAYAKDYSVRPVFGLDLLTQAGTRFKLAATLATYGDAYINGVQQTGTNTFAFGVTFGVTKKYRIFNFAIVARIGLNENRYEENASYSLASFNNGSYKSGFDADAVRFGVAFQLGWDFHKNVGIKFGAGYQISGGLGKYTPLGDINYNRVTGKYVAPAPFLNTFAVFIQLPLKLDAHWELVPEIGSHIFLNVEKFEGASFYAMLQMRSIF